MIILNALYRKPVNIEAFHTHYDTVHMPLVRKVPSLLKAEVEMVTTTYAGEKDDFYMLAHMYYENDESFKTCLLYTSPSPRDKRQSRMPSSA